MPIVIIIMMNDFVNKRMDFEVYFWDELPVGCWARSSGSWAVRITKKLEV